MTINLDDLLEQVNSKETFLRFAYALSADFKDEQEKEAANSTLYLGVVQGPNGWYNHTIDAFLEQMCLWASATSTITDEPMVSEEASWRNFARMLSMGKEYE